MLRAFDASLTVFLVKLMKDSGDNDLKRRVETLETTCLFGGKGVPSRKLVSMVAFRAIRDPKEEDRSSEAAFSGCKMVGTTVDDGIAFIDNLLSVLGTTRVGLDLRR